MRRSRFGAQRLVDEQRSWLYALSQRMLKSELVNSLTKLFFILAAL